MVAIVSGNSLGLELTSWGSLGNQGLWGSASQGGSGEQVYVNAATGNLVVQRRDEFLASRGLDNEALRTYNSLGLSTDDNKDNWSLGVYAQQMALSGTVNTVGSTLTRAGRDGSQALYTWDAERNCYVTRAGSGAHDTIVYDSVANQYVRTDGSSRDVEKYSAATGRLQNVADADGRTNWYVYTNGYLSKVTDRSGEVVYYDYVGNKLTAIRTEVDGKDDAGNAIRVTRSAIAYGYDAAGRLETVTVDLTPADGSMADPDVYVTTYTYEGAGASDTRIKTLTQSDGSSLSFTYAEVDGAMRVQTITDATGAVTEYAYDTFARRTAVTLTTLTGGPRRTWLYDYDPSGQLLKLTTPAVNGAGLTQSYGYDADGNVSTITNGDGETTTMVYDANGNMTRVVDALGNAVTRTYGTANQLLTETVSTLTTPALADGANVSIAGGEVIKSGGVEGMFDAGTYSSQGYIGQASVSFQAGQNNKAFMAGLNTEPAANHGWSGLDFAFYCRGNGQLEVRESGDPNNKLGATTTYKASDVLRISYDGSYVRYFQNEVEIYKTAATITKALHVDTSFYAIGAKLVNLRFGDQAPNLTTRYAYSESNPQLLCYAVSPQGRVTRYDYNTLGQRVAQITYPEHVFDTSGLAPTQAPSLAQLDAWVSDIGDLSGTARVEYSYDARGLLSTLSQYLGAKTDGSGLYPRQTKYIYDQAGRLLQTIQSASDNAADEAGTPITTYAYDGLGRVISVLEPSGALSTTVYTDNSRTATVRYQSGAVATSVFDKAGRLISVAKADTSGSEHGTTTYAYDAFGRLVMTTDPTGVRRFAIYDEAGRQVGDVDGDGTLTEAVYDNAGRVIRIQTYATAVKLTLFVSANGTALNPRLADVRPAAVAQDLQRWNVYDNAGRLVYEVAETGAVTQSDYDGAGRLVRRLSYSVGIATTGALTLDDVAEQLSSAQVKAGAADDRSQRYFYDDDGLLVGMLDGEGYLTHHTHDQAGRKVQTLQYATAVAASLRNTGALGTLTPQASDDDQTTTYFYNTRGLLIGTVDAEGYVTRNAYNARGQQLDQIRYAKPLGSPPDWTADFETLVKQIRGGGPYDLAPDDRATYWRYRLDGQVFSMTNHEGTKTSYEYDSAGRLTKLTLGTGLSDARTNLTRYDAFGRKTAELSGRGSAKITAGMSAEQIEVVWASNSTRYTYDKAGRLSSSTDPNGFKTLYFYDVDGRLTHTVNARGEVQQTQYNVLGQRTAAIRYNGAISLQGLIGGLAPQDLATRLTAVANAIKDSRIGYGWDAYGRQTGLTDEMGGYTESRFNLFGEVSERWVPRNDVANINQDKRRETFDYDRRGALLQVVKDADAIAATTDTTYDAFGRITSITDANRKTGKIDHDRLGRVVTRTDALGKKVVTTYDAFGQVLTVTDELEKITTFNYDRAKREVTVTSPENVSVTTTHTAYGQTYTIKNGNDVVTTYVYDLDGNLTETKVGTQTVETRDYDQGGRLVSTIDANRVRTTYVFDDVKHTLTRTVEPTDSDGDVELNLQTVWQYDAKGQAWQVTDARGTVTEYSFDLAGRTIKQVVDTAGLKLTTEWRHDAEGRVVIVVDPNKVTTKYVFDKLGRRTDEVVDFGEGRLNLARGYTYDGNGNVLTAIDAAGAVTTYRYDSVGRLTYIATPAAVDVATGKPRYAVTRNDYDAKGQLIRTTRFAKLINEGVEPASVVADLSSDRVTSYVYDDAGRLKYTVDAAGAVVHLAYDGNGNISQRTAFSRPIDRAQWSGISAPPVQPDGNKDQVERYAYDDFNRLTHGVKIENPADGKGSVTSYKYDSNGNLVLTVEYNAKIEGDAHPSTVVGNIALDRTTVNRYDSANRLIWQSNPEGGVTRLDYDGNGNITTRTEYARSINPGADPSTVTGNAAADRVTRMSYDRANRLTYTVDAMRYVQLNRHDAVGRIVEVTRYGTELEAGKEPVDVKVDPSKDRSTRYAHDAAGRQRFMVDAEGYATERSYDAVGNVESEVRYATRLLGNMVDNPSANAGDDAGWSGSVDAVDSAQTGLQLDGKVFAASDRDSYATGWFAVSEGEGFDLSMQAIRAVVNDSRSPYAVRIGLAYSVDGTSYGTWQAASSADTGRDGVQQLRGQLRVPAGYKYARVWVQIDGPRGSTGKWYLDNVSATRTSGADAGRVAQLDSATDRLTTLSRWVTRSVDDCVDRFVYDRAGRVLAKTAAAGSEAVNTITYSYNAFGQLVAETDARGNALATSDSAWAKAERLRFGYKSDTVQLTAADKQALLDRYTARHDYDRVGRRVATTNALGATTRTAYNAFGNATKVTDPRGHSAYFYHDGLGRVTLQVDAEGYANEIAYTNVFGNQVQSVWRRFTRVTGSYDENTRPTLTTDALKDARLQYSEYDRLDRLTKNSDHVGNSETIAYGVPGNRFEKSVTNKLGGKAAFTYDKLGRLTSETLPVKAKNQAGTLVDVVNQYGYNAFGDRTDVTEAVGLVEQRSTTFGFDKLGRTVRRIGTAYTAFDAASGTSSTITPVQVTTYDALGRVIGVLSGANWTGGVAVGGSSIFSYYDPAGRMIAQVERDGATKIWAYDPSGNVSRETALAAPVAAPTRPGGALPAVTYDAANDRVTASFYDGANRLVETRRDAVVYWEQDSDDIKLQLSGQPTTITLQKFTYDANGNLVQEIDARGNSIFSYYDKLGRKTLRIDQEGYATGWEFGDVFDQATTETRYAVRVGSFARQDDNTKPPEWRTPSSLCANLTSVDNRVIRFAFDRAGRNTEKRVLGVQYSQVLSNGNVHGGKADAVTTYHHNGLGAVDAMSVRYAVLSDGTEMWNTTDYTFDKLGRQTSVQSPGYVDYLGNTVRPQTDTEYDGLGNVKRQIRRGTNSAVETDDRINRYAYDANGLCTSVTDAANNVTLYDYDANGALARRTVKAVKDADGSSTDIITAYLNDGLGRVIRQTDTGTGEVRRFRYNAFGQLSGKGLGGTTVWQEFIEYNTLGLIQKSNIDGGAVKIYIYDRTGNATREIAGRSDIDLRNMSVIAAAADTRLAYRFSSYDKRSLLVRTVEPDLKYDQYTIDGTNGAFTEALETDPYAALSLDGSQGGRYSEGQVDTAGYKYTTVGGADSSDGQKLSLANPPYVYGGTTYGSLAPVETIANASVSGFRTVTWAGSNLVFSQGDAANKTYTFPSSWPKGEYRLRDTATNRILATTSHNGLGGSFSVPPGEEGVSDKRSVDYKLEGTDCWISAAQLEYGVQYEPGSRNESWSSSESRQLITTKNASVTHNYASINTGTSSESPIACRRPVNVINGVPTYDYWLIDTTGLSAGSYEITYRGFDSSMNTVAAEKIGVTVGDGSTKNSSVQLIKSDVWAKGSNGGVPSLTFRPDRIGGTGHGTLYYRVLNSGSQWTSVPLNSWAANLTGAAWLPQDYEFIVESTFAANQWHGNFAMGGNGTTGSIVLKDNGMAGSVSRLPQTFEVDVTNTLSDPAAINRTVTVRMNGVTRSAQVITRQNQSGQQVLVASFIASDFGVTPSSWRNDAFSYTYEVRGRRTGDSIDQFIGAGDGKVQFGSDPKVLTVNAPTTYYQPLALLTLPSGTSLAGDVTVTYAGSSVTIRAGDWRRKTLSATQLGIDLSQWFAWGAAKTLTISYSASDAVFTGQFTLAGTGQTDCTNLTAQSRQPLIPISVTGATRLSVLKVCNFFPNDQAEQREQTLAGSANISSRAPGSNGTFVWDASDQAGLGRRSFYYEAVDAQGRTIGKGYGDFTLEASGLLTCDTYVAELKPSYFYLTPPPAPPGVAVTLEFSTRLKGTNGAFVAQPLVNGPAPGQMAFDATNQQPETGKTELEYRQVAKDAKGNILSSGGGTLTILSTGAVSSTHVEDRRPTIVTLYGPPGKEVPKLQVNVRPAGSTGAYTSATVVGTWDAERDCTVFRWNATDFKLSGTTTSIVPETGTAQYDYLFKLQKADGSSYTELGTPITMDGVMTLGGTASEPVTLQQRVQKLLVTAQVQHRQSYNAFGEISEEYDDITTARAQEMATRHGGTADLNLVRTTFAYNALGQLITKTDPQTHATAANGYRYRTRPLTTYGYDLSGRLTTDTDANGFTKRQSYTGDGSLAEVEWAADQGRTGLGYDVFGDLRKRSDALDRVTEYGYDKNSNLVAATRLGVTRAENFADANKVATTLADTYTYDALGRRLTHTNALSWVEKTWYDSLGRIVKTMSPLDVQTATGSDADSSTTYTYTFVEAGVALASGGIIGAGGISVGGYKLTTTGIDKRSTVDRIDYFGNTTWHSDQGNRAFTYNYDWTGHLSSQTSTSGQDIRYDYFANGYVRTVKDLANDRTSLYGYDNAGQRVSEMYANLTTDGNGPEGAYQNSKIIYDELGRMSVIEDHAHKIQYEYDAVGNRRRVDASYIDPLWDGNLRGKDDFWYTYDATNRFTLTKGALLNNKRGTSLSDTTARIVQGAWGIEIGYDKLGQRTSAKDASGKLEEYTYASDGVLEDYKLNGVLQTRRRADALGRTLQYKEYDSAGALKRNTVSTYDRDSRLKDQKVYEGSNGTTLANTTTYKYYTDTGDNLTSAAVEGRGALASTFRDAADSNAADITTTYRYAYWDFAKQSEVKNDAKAKGVQDWADGFSRMSYDANGFLIAAHDAAGARHMNYFNSATGQVLQRNEVQEKGAGTEDDILFQHFWYYANGRRVGEVTTDPEDNQRVSYAEALAKSLADPKKEAERLKHIKPITSADFDQNYEPVGPNYPAATPSTYIASTGDTLRGAALALWGDADMWYLLAQANNLRGDEPLQAGQVLIVPNRVTNIHNNSNTFRPYSPGEVIGDVNPTLPAPPAQELKCGLLSQVLAIVVTVVVTAYTGDPVLGAAAGNMAGQYSLAAFNGQLDYWDMARGGGTRGMRGGVKAAALYAVGGFPAIGLSDDDDLKRPPGFTRDMEFDHKSMAAAAATAAVASYASSYFGGTQAGASTGTETGGAAASSPAVASSTSATPTTVGDWAAHLGRGAAVGAAGTAASQVVQGKWDWRGIAAGAVGGAAGAGASAAVGQALGTAAPNWGRYARQVAYGMANGWTAGQITADDPRSSSSRMGELFVTSLAGTVSQALVDDVGNALGQGLVDSMQSSGYEHWPDQTGAEDARLNRYEAAALTQEAGNNRTSLNAFNRDNDPYYSTSYENWPDETDAERARLDRYEATAVDQERANNRTLLNKANKEADRSYYQPKPQSAAARERQWIKQDDFIMNRRAGDPMAGGMRAGPTVERSRALGIYAGDAPALTGPSTVGKGSPGAYVSSWDPSRGFAREAENQRVRTSIGLAAGGPVFTGLASGARLLGAPDHVVNDIGVAQTGLVASLAAPLLGVGSVALSPVRVPLRVGSGSLSGEPEVAPRNANADHLRSIQRQNEALELLPQHGFDVVRLPNTGSRGVTNPDAAINGQLADVYSPRTGNLWTVRDNIAAKVEAQAPNVVLNLVDSPLTAAQVIQHLQVNPVPVNNLIIIKNGQVIVVGN